MLTPQQIAHFRTFGFLLLPRVFDAEEMAVRSRLTAKLYGNGQDFSLREVKFHYELTMDKINGKFNYGTYLWSYGVLNEKLIDHRAAYNPRAEKYKNHAQFMIDPNRMGKFELLIPKSLPAYSQRGQEFKIDFRMTAVEDHFGGIQWLNCN